MEQAIVYNDYTKKLRYWRYSLKYQQWMWNHHSFMQWLTRNGQLNLLSNQTVPGSAVPQPVRQSQPQQTAVGTTNRFQDFRIASMSRRAVAEIADFSFLLIFKTVTLLMMLYCFNLDFSFVVHSNGLLDVKFVKIISQGEFEKLLDEDSLNELLTNETEDGDHLLAVDNHLTIMLIITCVYRLISLLYEWFCIWCWESTPGKSIFGIKVVSCNNALSTRVTDIVSVYPGTPVSGYNSFLRSLIKNLSIAFLIPAFATAFFYPHRRTSYDIMTNTIVIHKNYHRQNR
ncbi:protein FAM8A1-like [Clavelina lepadiformis]|uniref:protein FAM8A1-like n=1 Tax=Clavelina lepadiformis TaxID=159417 RepID=UPI0040433E09